VIPDIAHLCLHGAQLFIARRRILAGTALPCGTGNRRTNGGPYIKSGKDVWNGENKFRRNCNTAPLADLNAKAAGFFSARGSAATQEVLAPGFPSDSQA
jgi:hypothetical protein